MNEHEQRWWDLPAVVLLMIAILTSGIRLQETNWAPDLYRLEFLLFFSYALGLALGVSRFRERGVFWLALAYSLLIVGWQLSLTVVGEDFTTGERLLLMLARLVHAMITLLGNHPITDPILFLGSMFTLYWLCSLIAAYQLVRSGNPWVPLLIAGLALAVVDYFHPTLESRFRYSGMYALMVLILMGRLYFLRSRQAWYRKDVTLEAEVGYDLTRSVLVGALVLVLLAWNLPRAVSASTPGTKQNKELQASLEKLRGRFSNAVAGLQGTYSNEAPLAFLNELELGTSVSVSDDVVFIVTASGFSPSGMRFYWRGRTYDEYQNGQWRNSLPERRSVGSQAWPFEASLYRGRQDLDFSFVFKEPYTRTLFLPNYPLSVDTPTEVGYSPAAGGNVDIVSVEAVPSVRAEETVKVTARLAAPNVALLQEKDREYPSWVTRQYLQLPLDFPPAIRDLAQQITQDQPTTYDKVMAVTQYLRDNITYAGEIEVPPQGKDAIEWFLFDYKKGFCYYYATAEVLMLRSVGIPARMAVGFAQGDASNSTYTVRRKDSHAWPEVFFPEVGWVEFEPTVSQPLGILPTGLESAAAETNPADNTPPEDLPSLNDLKGRDLKDIEDVNLGGGGAARTNALPWVLGVIGILAALGTFTWAFVLPPATRLAVLAFPVHLEFFFSRRGWAVPAWLVMWSRWSRLSPIERQFVNVTWMLRVLGQTSQPGMTPAEHVALLVETRPEMAEKSAELLQEVHTELYSPRRGDLGRARRAIWSLWGAVLRARLEFLQEPGAGGRFG